MPWTGQTDSTAFCLSACELPGQPDSILLIRIWSQTESPTPHCHCKPPSPNPPKKLLGGGGELGLLDFLKFGRCLVLFFHDSLAWDSQLQAQRLTDNIN